MPRPLLIERENLRIGFYCAGLIFVVCQSTAKTAKIGPFENFPLYGTCGKDLITPFYPPRWCFEARVGLFKCQGRSRKQFLLLWKSSETCASMFMWGKDLVSPFYPPRRSCEARVGLFMFQRRSREQISPL